jgi:hypothetical protein
MFAAEGEDVARGVVADADEHVAELVEGVDPVQLARGDERVEDARSLRALLAAREELVFVGAVDAGTSLAGLVLAGRDVRVVRDSPVRLSRGGPRA